MAPSLPEPVIPLARAAPLEDRPVAGRKRVLLAAPRGYCAGVGPRRGRGREGARALRRTGVRAQADRAQHPRRLHARSGAARSSSTTSPRCRSARTSCSAPTASRRWWWRMLLPATCRRSTPTCPLVTKVHREATRFARDDFEILLIGHAGARRGRGTMGHAPERATLVNGPEDVAERCGPRSGEARSGSRRPRCSVDETMETVRLLRERFPSLQDPPSDDICYATPEPPGRDQEGRARTPSS